MAEAVALGLEDRARGEVGGQRAVEHARQFGARVQPDGDRRRREERIRRAPRLERHEALGEVIAELDQVGPARAVVSTDRREQRSAPLVRVLVVGGVGRLRIRGEDDLDARAERLRGRDRLVSLAVAIRREHRHRSVLAERARQPGRHERDAAGPERVQLARRERDAGSGGQTRHARAQRPGRDSAARSGRARLPPAAVPIPGPMTASRPVIAARSPSRICHWRRPSSSPAPDRATGGVMRAAR